MRTTLYTKVSDYRSKKYNLITEIIDIDGKRYARKKAGCDEAKQHLEQIFLNAERLKNIMEPECKVCDVKNDDDAALFEFVDGKNYEELLSDAVKESDCAKVYELIASYHDIVYKMKTQKGFTASERFSEIFGDFPEDEDMYVGDYVDVDLIFSNVFMLEKPCIIDYEWCFDFQIPLDYVFWRGLFTSKAFSLLPDDIKNRIYDEYSLSEEKREYFLEMETKFVEHSGSGDISFSDEISKIRPVVYDERNLMWRVQSYPIVFFSVKGGKAKPIFKGVSYPGHNRISFTIKEDYDRLELFVAPLSSVISDIHVKDYSDGTSREVTFETTSETDNLVPKYFIKNTPVILVKEKCSDVTVEFVVDIWNSEAINENNLSTYIDSLFFSNEKSEYESGEKHKTLDMIKQKIQEKNAEIQVLREEIRKLQDKNIYKGTYEFIKLRKRRNDK